jgi:hypothetical protein
VADARNDVYGAGILLYEVTGAVLVRRQMRSRWLAV